MSNQSTIRVLLVDDYALVRSGLAATLMCHKDLQLVGEAADGEEAIRLCGPTQPDVILMDLQMPRMDGVTATARLRQQYPETQVLVLTSHTEDKLVQEAFEAGAIGYLLKNVTGEELASAIRAVYRRQPALAPEVTRSLINLTRQHQTPRLGHDLSEREHDVLSLMAKGYDNQHIADNLFVSQATVKFHVGNILSKLQVASRTQAVSLVLQQHLLD